MSKQVQSLTTNTSVFLGNVVRPRNFDEWKGLFFVYGTFGGGTVSWLWSPDGGITKLAMTDYTGTAITSSANDSFKANFETGSDNNDRIQLYATLSGGSNSNLTVGFYDNH